MEEKTDHQLLTLLVAYKGRIFCSALGFLTRIFVLWLGWIKALSFLFCVVVGYYVGKKADGGNNILTKIKELFYRRRFK